MLSVCLLLFASADLRVEVSSAEIQIGEPVVCIVALGGIEGSTPTLSEEALEPSLAWFVREAPSIRRDPGGELTLSWTVLALEPEPGPLPVPVLLQDGEPLTLSGPQVVVAGALEEGEDAPRPARGFYIPGPEGQLASTGAWLFALFGALAMGLMAWSLWRRRAPLEFVEPSLFERLTSLEGPVDGDDPLVVDWHGELTRILRAAYSDDQAGWSDEEWIERAELSEAHREELRGLFAACAAVKYGGVRPTRFAVEETLARARALVSEVEEVAA